MKTTIRITFLLCCIACFTFGHEWIDTPFPRTKECPVNGIVMTTVGNNYQIDYDATGDSYKQVSENEKDMFFHANSMYLDRPCGNSRYGKLDKTVELCNRFNTKDDYDWDFSIEPRTSIPTYQANSVVELIIKAPDFHPGLVSIRLCYDLPCMKWESYEKYILGYWYNEGVSGLKFPDPAEFKIYVKLPNRNCDRCVLQFLTDSVDARSYVNCADIKITGASSQGPSSSLSYCNGHPLCDCGSPSYSKSFFGLKGKCPGKASGQLSNEVVKNVGEKQFCDWCISNGCPFSCGSVWKAMYNTPNKNFNNHKSAIDNPQYILCDRKSCYCPGCRPTVRQLVTSNQSLPPAFPQLQVENVVKEILDESSSVAVVANQFLLFVTLIAVLML